MALSDATLLVLDKVGGGFTLEEFSARGISMTLSPIDESAQIEYDVNANLVDLMEGFDQFKKYQSTISCTDMESPGFAAGVAVADRIWLGTKFNVTCLPSLGAVDPITLVMMVIKPWQVTTDEWGAAVSWSLDLKQV